MWILFAGSTLRFSISRANLSGLQRLDPIFSAYFAENMVAFAVKGDHNIRKRCGDYGEIYTRTARMAEISLGYRGVGRSIGCRSASAGAVDRTNGNPWFFFAG
ncbi:hypothetical protein TRIP_B350045 [uncultured Desulfatiglans sp.]|nr:hypothetical protein TRIP_B350045 [uncultured Desulfatiglans sp.]